MRNVFETLQTSMAFTIRSARRGVPAGAGTSPTRRRGREPRPVTSSARRRDPGLAAVENDARERVVGHEPAPVRRDHHLLVDDGGEPEADLDRDAPEIPH